MKTTNIVLGAIFPCALLAACSGSGTSSVGSSSSALSGPVELRVVQSPDIAAPLTSLGVKSIVVTVVRVDARVEGGGWQPISVQLATIDLLALPATLGVTKLPAGNTESLRLIVSPSGPSSVTTNDGVVHPLFVPSGDTSGIKIVGDFDVAPCAGGHVTFSFAGDHGIVVRPAGDGDGDLDDDAGLIALGAWVLRPVIRIEEVVTGGTCNGDDDDDGQGNGHGHGDHDDSQH
jgi:hypothetical protein